MAKNKRLKLEYEELPSNSSASEKWNKLLTNESMIDKENLIDAVKSGMSQLELNIYISGVGNTRTESEAEDGRN